MHIDTKDGVPICQYCKADDCAHVGFTICLDQLHGRGETLESIEADAEAKGTTAVINEDNQTTTKLLIFFYPSVLSLPIYSSPNLSFLSLSLSSTSSI